MCTVAAAAGGQAGNIVSQGSGQGAEQEDGQKQNGSAAPHMELSVQEGVCGTGRVGKQGRHSAIIEVSQGQSQAFTGRPVR
jgi:hypothetical protein